MAINGTISVSALFHDTDGTTAIAIASVRSSNEHASGKVAVVSGTAGTASVIVLGYDDPQPTSYRDASGSLVTFGSISRVVFSWSGSLARTLTPDGGAGDFALVSSNGRASVTDYNGLLPVPTVSGGEGTGTYTILLYGT